jgi:predicted extracellular nuclease
MVSIADVSGPSISITTLGTPITQNFDTLATSGTANTWTDDTTLPGWYSQFVATPTNPTTYRADAGTSNTGAIYSYGTGTSTERAFGSLSSGTPGDIYIAVKLTNNTGSAITSLGISYIGEQWRNGGNTSAQNLDFQFQVAAAGTITDANTPSTGWTDFDTLDFVSPTTGATAAALDGNAAANRTAKSANLPLTVSNGQEVWLRWKDTNDAGNDHGLAIDDFSVTASAAATPTPTPTPTLNVGDVAQTEGDSGQTNFTFTVSLTSPAPAGGVTFNVDTADGTAQDGTPAGEDNDYVAVHTTGSIAAGSSSTTVNVPVNGDTTVEANETFTVNVSNIVGALPGDTQGLGTIQNDDASLTGICQIQGSGTTSPVVGANVTTRGVVTGIKIGSGFYIQDDACDSDPATSNGVFVFTGATIPAAAAIGNRVQVQGTVQEFIPSADTNQKPLTEIGGSPTVIVITTGDPLPTPVTITAADTLVNNVENLERLEGMRVRVNSLTVVAPTQGTINEPNATVASTGVFHGVITGIARPFREPGINATDPLPAGAPPTVPRFDENPERIRVDSDAQPGTTALDLNTGTVVTNLVGELDYSFRSYTIIPEAGSPPSVGTQIGSTPVPAASANEVSVASFNMERFFDTANDPGTSDPVLTTTAFNKRLGKASLIIRNVQHLPDVIGVEEMENLSTLQAVATQVNNDETAASGINPNYHAYLVEGNDIGGIDVGFLVKESRVTTIDVTQFGKDTTYVEPGGATALLNDRPPLVLRASIPRPSGGTFAFTVIVNHLRSLSGVDDPADGNRVRTKRRAQAEFLANLIQSRQTADPTEKIITVGDMNAFQVNDGYVDVIGTIKGTPAPASQVTLASPDLVNPDLTDLVDTLPPSQQYSFTFDGNAQVLDHIIVNQPALAAVDRFVYARDDSDFAVKNYELLNELRISDHDQPVAYFSLGAPQPQGSFIISEFRFRGPGLSAQVTAPSGGRDTFKTAPPVSTDGSAPNAPGTSADNDEFIEFYNNTDSDITVSTTDGSAGWALVAADGVMRFVIPNNTFIPARGHYLAVNSDGYSLSGYSQGTADGDINYTQDIPNGSGIALFRSSDPASFSTTTRLDAAGYTGVDALYREGNGFATGGGEMTLNLEYSYYRSMCSFVQNVGCTVAGTPKDSGDNTADFIAVDTQATTTGQGQHLGAPGPENLSSPIQRNTQMPLTLLDPNASSSQAPNRVRDFTADVANHAPQGKISIRRTVTNNTGGPITWLRFRVVEVTTFPRPNGATADLRPIDSGDIQVMVNGTPVDVRGTQLDQPPTQPNGGGFNTSMNVGFINLGSQLANNDTVSVQFVLGVQQGGSFRFYVNVEALDENVVGTAPVTRRSQR